MGRNEGKITSILSKIDEFGEGVHYICGPNGLKQTVKAVLSKFDILPNMIYAEDFDIFIDKKQWDEFETRSVKLISAGQITYVEVTKGKSILNVCLDQGIDMPYSCQIGTCK